MAFSTNRGLGGALTSFRPRPTTFRRNPGLGGAYTSFRGPQADTTTPAVSTASAMPAPAASVPQAPTAPTSLDSIFNTGVAGLMFSNKNQRDALTAQNGQDTQDFNTMLARMADQRAQDLLSTNHQANREGLFYSGQLGKRRDNVEKSYSQQEQDARTAYNRAQEARAQALAQLGSFTADPNSPTGYTATGQAGIDLADLLNQAISRRTAANAGGVADAAAATQIAPTPTPAAAPAAADGPIVIRPSKSHGGAKWVYRIGASGKPIPIRPA